MNTLASTANMQDSFQRTITYLRVSLTDRCDLRCRYCMSEAPPFLPRDDLLSLEEMERLCQIFIDRGVRKIRLTGGEPLLRHEVMTLVNRLGQRLHDGQLDELVLTTNATRLTTFAQPLAEAGVRRINVSLDTLKPDRFDHLTRRPGKLPQVLDGIEAARQAGLKVKINTVALTGFNDDEFDDLLRWCGDRGLDLTLIEAMPLNGEGGAYDGPILPLATVQEDLARRWTLTPTVSRNGAGPARQMMVAETGTRLGFITPMSHNFCASCNRVRVTCTGTLYPCLGQDMAFDLRTPLRASPDSDAEVHAALDQALHLKPEGHNFAAPVPSATRRMSLTGG